MNKSIELPKIIYDIAETHIPSADYLPREPGHPNQVLSQKEVERLLDEVSENPPPPEPIDFEKLKPLLRQTLARLWIMTDRQNSEYEIIGEDLILREFDFPTLVHAVEDISFEVYKIRR